MWRKKSNKRMIFTLTAMALLTVPEISRAETWSLQQCVDYAISHNISIQQGEQRVKSGELAITEAKDGFLPQVDASASQSFNFGRGLTAENTYANRNTSSTSWNVGFSLPLFQGLKEYKRVKVAELSLQQYLWESGSAKDNVTLNVMSQYLQVLYCKEVVRSSESQAELSAYQVERQKALIEAGKVAEATLYDLEAVAAQDRLQVVTAGNDLQTAIVNLTNLLLLPSAEDFDVAPLDEQDPSLSSAEEVYSQAQNINNSLLGARQAVKVADENISMAKTGFIPTLSFSGGIGSSYYTVSGMQSENFGNQMRHNFSTYLGLSLRIPIFDAFSTRNSIRRSRMQKLDAELALEQRETDLQKEIQLAYYQAKGARERYLTSEETLEKTRLSFEATRERFDLGRATQADYEQAKNNLFKTEVTRIQAHYEYLLRAKVLQFYQTNHL
ncbi:MAG: TolC family protein [Muribaculaceae bacterium]|nr:TolC family protein [Muribaculaceae bacterium]